MIRFQLKNYFGVFFSQAAPGHFCRICARAEPTDIERDQELLLPVLLKGLQKLLKAESSHQKASSRGTTTTLSKGELKKVRKTLLLKQRIVICIF